jgi:hypothetical protein
MLQICGHAAPIRLKFVGNEKYVGDLHAPAGSRILRGSTRRRAESGAKGDGWWAARHATCRHKEAGAGVWGLLFTELVGGSNPPHTPQAYMGSAH